MALNLFFCKEFKKRNQKSIVDQEIFKIWGPVFYQDPFNGIVQQSMLHFVATCAIIIRIGCLLPKSKVYILPEQLFNKLAISVLSHLRVQHDQSAKSGQRGTI
ncbi:hypothetical protein BpHYR1_022391 [Brachionus plicatilis]|uniref:Uncharacterized protein n=1 Tax=Brachionus plicatilis TaxID=10195 RepID=A0A3M7QMR3_BRAPC|nr:hypothetical protein BpHYR1_022391 [Brachionus plicatilis]